MGKSSDVLEHLRRGVTTDRTGDPSWAGAIRLRVRMQPAGGPGTKVMPPTYAPERSGEPPVYVEETRRIGGEARRCVSLDSVASQANRAEAALVDEIALANAHVPTIWVDQGEFGIHSALEFSHRTYDAWIEDAVLDGERFGDTDRWAQLASSKRRDLTALMRHSPVSILLGGWAARVKNPRSAARLPRILTSEIVAVGAEKGARPKSKRDIHDVSAGLVLYRAGEDSRERVVLDPEQAARTDAGKEELFADGRPSSAGYGSVTPSLADHGGITMDYGLQIATISLPAIRECRFPAGGKHDDARNAAGRLMLLALGLHLLALQVERGYDLRSDCLLMPEDEPAFESIDRLGKPVETWTAIETDTAGLLEAAIEQGAEHGLDWADGDVWLKASDVQLALLRGSLVKPAAVA